MAEKRWGWSALSKSRINDAYVQEVMMDKATGEMLIKVDSSNTYRSYDYDARTRAGINALKDFIMMNEPKAMEFAICKFGSPNDVFPKLFERTDQDDIRISNASHPIDNATGYTGITDSKKKHNLYVYIDYDVFRSDGEDYNVISNDYDYVFNIYINQPESNKTVKVGNIHNMSKILLSDVGITASNGNMIVSDVELENNGQNVEIVIHNILYAFA